MKPFAALLILAGLCCAPAQGASEVIHIRGYVPVICRADFLASPAPAGAQVRLGVLDEFCNAGAGYQIVADYPSSDDPGALVIDGRKVPLDASGHAVLAVMDGPRAVTQTLSYIPGRTPIATLRIQLLPGAI